MEIEVVGRRSSLGEFEILVQYDRKITYANAQERVMYDGVQ